MLGMPYDYAIDVWSIGCTLYELYTGKILFTGDSNNQMLKSIMEIRGKMPPKTYRKGELAAMHFDDKGNFVSVERDKVLGKVCVFLFLCLPARSCFPPPVGAAVVCIGRRSETFGLALVSIPVPGCGDRVCFGAARSKRRRGPRRVGISTAQPGTLRPCGDRCAPQSHTCTPRRLACGPPHPRGPANR